MWSVSEAKKQQLNLQEINSLTKGKGARLGSPCALSVSSYSLLQHLELTSVLFRDWHC